MPIDSNIDSSAWIPSGFLSDFNFADFAMLISSFINATTNGAPSNLLGEEPGVSFFNMLLEGLYRASDPPQSALA